MRAAETYEDKVHRLTRGYLRLKEAVTSNGTLHGVEDVDRIVQRVFAEVSKMLGNGIFDVKLPDMPDLMHADPSAFVGKFKSTWRPKSVENRYIAFSETNANGFPPGILGYREYIREMITHLEWSDRRRAKEFTGILTTQETGNEHPVFMDIMLDGGEIAQESLEFRRQFHETTVPTTIAVGGGEGKKSLRLAVSAPLIDYLNKDRHRADIAKPDIKVAEAFHGWKTGKGSRPYRPGLLNADCLQNFGEPRLFPWIVRNFSGGEIPMSDAELRELAVHVGHYAHDTYKDAAYALNCAHHAGSLEYFVVALLEATMLLKDLEDDERVDTPAAIHKRLLKELMEIQVFGVHEHVAPYREKTPKDEFTSELIDIGSARKDLQPHLAEVLTHWNRMVKRGKDSERKLNVKEKEKEGDRHMRKTAEGLTNEKNKSAALERKLLGMTKILTLEAQNTAGWEEPLDFLSSRLKLGGQKQGVFYHRETAASPSHLLSKAQAFEIEMLKTLAKKHGMTSWAFTVANTTIVEMANWMATCGAPANPSKLRDEIGEWISSTTDARDLRKHLMAQCEWPSERDAAEDRVITNGVNYWQAVCGAKLELEHEGILTDVHLAFGGLDLNECVRAARFLEENESEFVDIGGKAAEYFVRNKKEIRRNVMAIEHKNTASRYHEDYFDLALAFRHAAHIAGTRYGYGSPYDTSLIEYKDNQRILEGMNSSNDLKGTMDRLKWIFPLQGRVHENEPVDVLLFTPQGEAGVGLPLNADSEDDSADEYGRDLVGSGSFGGGGGLAVL